MGVQPSVDVEVRGKAGPGVRQSVMWADKAASGTRAKRHGTPEARPKRPHSWPVLECVTACVDHAGVPRELCKLWIRRCGLSHQVNRCSQPLPLPSLWSYSGRDTTACIVECTCVYRIRILRTVLYITVPPYARAIERVRVLSIALFQVHVGPKLKLGRC